MIYPARRNFAVARYSQKRPLAGKHHARTDRCLLDNEDERRVFFFSTPPRSVSIACTVYAV